MAIKIYCDFCEKEISGQSESAGTLRIVSKAISLISPNSSESQQEGRVELFQLCHECCQKALKALKIKEPK